MKFRLAGIGAYDLVRHAGEIRIRSSETVRYFRLHQMRANENVEARIGIVERGKITLLQAVRDHMVVDQIFR